LNERFLQHLAPERGHWAVETFAKRDAEIWTGIITLNGRPIFPVINGIPRLLQGPLLARLALEYRDYWEKFGATLASRGLTVDAGLDAGMSLKLSTSDSFGYQWNTFGRMLDVYEENHRMYFRPYGRELFDRKLVLDAGCGSGRHVYYAAKYGAEVVAIDLSNAVEVAYANTMEYRGRVHIAQADIDNLPLATNHFDMVESIGVIHHVPDPDASFANLSRHVRAGGLMYVYLYSDTHLRNAPPLLRAKVAFKESLLRPLSRKLPPPALRAWCWVMAAAGRVLFHAPGTVLSAIPATRSLAQRLPLAMYRGCPMYVLHTDLFDWISTPVNRYYDASSVEGFFSRNAFENVEVLGDPGWRAFGRKPDDRHTTKAPLNDDERITA